MGATAGSSTTPPASAEPRLRQSTLGQAESLGQSVANIAPTLTPALNVTVVATLAGTGAWLSYLVATIGMMLVAANIGALARRHPQSGSYFLYIGRNFGPFAGAMAGASMIAAYMFTAIAVTLGFTIFLANVLHAMHLDAYIPPVWLQIAVFVGAVWFAGYRDIQMSSRLALVLEGISIGIIVLITVAIVSRHGSVIDPHQLDPRNLPLGGVMTGLTFAVFSFVGFESAATLAKETRDPHVAVPRAIMVSAAGVGVFFVVMAYLMILAVGGDASIVGGSSAPFADLTERMGFGWMAGIVYFSAAVSGYACALASINAASRLVFSMGRYRFVQERLGSVHHQHQTPHVAVTACCGLVLVASLLLPLGALDAYGLTGTFGTLGFLLVYFLVCVFAPIDLRRTGSVSVKQSIVAVVGVLVVGFVIVGSLYPVPPSPFDLVPYLFLAYLALCAAWFGVLRIRQPGSLASIEHDLES